MYANEVQSALSDGDDAILPVNLSTVSVIALSQGNIFNNNNNTLHINAFENHNNDFFLDLYFIKIPMCRPNTSTEHPVTTHHQTQT